MAQPLKARFTTKIKRKGPSTTPLASIQDWLGGGLSFFLSFFVIFLSVIEEHSKAKCEEGDRLL